MSDFHGTRMGQGFYESTMPSIAESLEKIARQLEKPRCDVDGCKEQATLHRCAEHGKLFVEQVWVVMAEATYLIGIFATASAVKDALSPELDDEEREQLNRWTGETPFVVSEFVIRLETVQL